MRVKVGQYMLGYRNVDLWADPGCIGGHFKLAPMEGVAEVEVGTKYDHWSEVLNVLFHECMEFALCEVGARFKLEPSFMSGHDGYRFIFTHDQFTEATSRASYFICKSQTALAKIHRKHVAARRKAARKKK